MNLLGLPLTQLIDLVSQKKASPEEIYSYFIDRISNFDKDLNAFTTVVYDDAVQEIRPGLLHGIPLAVKDNFCTKALRTTASSRVLDEFIPEYESTVTEKLKQEGALVIGKTNMDAWAHGSSTETSDYGPTKNPWDTSRVPGGSSGGSAAAVSSYMAPAAIGSETAGSIRLPASWCGIVGLKPTYGRVSRYGVVAMGSSWDCPGPMTTTVSDAALLFDIMAGSDTKDATSATTTSESTFKTLSDIKPLTIGITDEYFDGVDNQVRQKIEEALSVFKKLGHTIKKISLMHPKYAISVYTLLQRAEVSSNLARFDGIRFGNDRDAFADEAKRRIMLGTYILSHGYYDAFYKKAQKVRVLIQEDFKQAFNDVDVIIGPSTPCTALQLGEWEKYPFFGETMDILSEPASAAGIPAISIPVGLDDLQLPVGLQIMGRRFDEKTILQLAHQFEKETDFFGVIKTGHKKYE